jgi:hypothetical protein
MSSISKENLLKIRKVERSINKNLFLICLVITVIIMAMVIIEFFSRGTFFPSRVGFFYIGVLFIYSVHKEMLRWLEEKGVDRQGEYFLYSWIGLTILFYVINFLTKDYFRISLEGKPTECMSVVSVITLEVGGIFLLARLSKVIKTILMKREK